MNAVGWTLMGSNVYLLALTCYFRSDMKKEFEKIINYQSSFTYSAVALEIPGFLTINFEGSFFYFPKY